MDKVSAALWWLDQGFMLLPVQPGTKYMVAGFGPYREKIKRASEVRYWFCGKSYNLAVYLGDGAFCLDFDSSALYVKWGDTIPLQIAWTYQETSPRGYHVFYRGRPPAGLTFVPGVEVKSIVLVHPSTVDGRVYQVIDPGSGILSVEDWRSVLSPLLSDPGLVAASPGGGLSKGENGGGRLDNPGGDLIGRIKAYYPIRDYVSRLTELSRSDRAGRWWRGRCPLHDDTSPSFWVDAQKNLWGCHACGVHGDVINLEARMKDVTVSEAIRLLAAELPGENK